MLKRRRGNRRTSGERTPWRLPQLPWRRIGAATGIAAGVLACAGLLLHWLDQPIERIEVQGRFEHLSALDVDKVVRGQLHGAGLVRVDLDAVRRALRLLPWVEAASVERSWPHGLLVHVAEQQAVARWNEGELVNTRGDLFPDARALATQGLPQLAGPAGTAAEVVHRYLDLQGRIVEAGMHLAAVRLDPRGAWELQLDNGVVVRVGRKQVDERCARFLGVALPLVALRAGDIAYVDMRYTSGFAVGWRGAGQTTAAAAHKEG
jgi:cell division protein FtsQ